MIRTPALLRRLIGCLVPMALAVSPMAASAAEETGLVIEAGGWSSGDASVAYSETSESWVVEGDDGGAFDGDAFDGSVGKARFAEVVTYDDAPAAAPSRRALASYGPFHLVAADTVEMIGTVDSATPRQFAALLSAHPGVRRLVMVDCPGSVDEAANHVLARAVRRAGLETLVPAGGSVRSGAVDLFLAGVRRQAAPSAEFGVHSWRDEDGHEASDFAAGDPVHAEYLGYYREMGLDEGAARRFYALTNSVGFEDVRYLGARDMARLGLAEIAG